MEGAVSFSYFSIWTSAEWQTDFFFFPGPCDEVGFPCKCKSILSAVSLCHSVKTLGKTFSQQLDKIQVTDVILFFFSLLSFGWVSGQRFVFVLFFLTQTGDFYRVEMICIYLTNFSLTVSKPCMSFLAVLLCSACLSKNKVVYQSGVGFLCMNHRVMCCVLQQWLDNSWWTLSFLATVK